MAVDRRLIRFLNEVERGGVHAIAQAGRARTILEDVTEMGAAAAAHHLSPAHAIAIVGGGFDVAFVEGSIEARPAASGVILRIRFEKLVAAAYAEEEALVMEVPVFAGEGGLGAFFAGDFELFGGQEFAPFVVGFVDFFGHREASWACDQVVVCWADLTC